MKDLVIGVDNLVKQYKDFYAVDGISFNVKKGEIFAFLGPNGAGKTTTIKMLTTLLKPTAGSLTIAGFDPVNEKMDARKAFSVVFQDPSLDEELTAYENMEFHAVFYSVPKDVMKKRIEHLLKFVGLWDRRDSLVETFSGGMKRRLEIARALTHHPKILFLDEPTIGLDPQTRDSIWKYIRELNKTEKMTVFMTTHYIEEAEKVADRVAIIDNGKILQIGSPKELIKLTKTKSLEEAFLKLTGRKIRDEDASSMDKARLKARMMGRR